MEIIVYVGESRYIAQFIKNNFHLWALQMYIELSIEGLK